MTKPTRWTRDELIALAESGTHKVDRMGERGATLCSQDEIIAMAAVVKHTLIVPKLLAQARADDAIEHPVKDPLQTED